MGVEEQFQRWIEMAEEDYHTAARMFESGYYMWCLFIAHLALEKLLKARYVKDTHTIPPKIHDLVKIAKATTLQLDSETIEKLDRFTDFNIEARYPEEKYSFYKLSTKELAESNLHSMQEVYGWLKSRIVSSQQ